MNNEPPKINTFFKALVLFSFTACFAALAVQGLWKTVFELKGPERYVLCVALAIIAVIISFLVAHFNKIPLQWFVLKNWLTVVAYALMGPILVIITVGIYWLLRLFIPVDVGFDSGKWRSVGWCLLIISTFPWLDLLIKKALMPKK